MKKWLWLALVCVELSGCSQEISPVSALALDKTDSGCRLTAEIVRQDTLDETASPSYLSVTGEDFSALLNALSNLLPGELYLSHAQVLLISEQAARESILPLADYLCTANDIRLSMRIAVVRDGEADALMKADDEIFKLSELLDRGADNGTLPDMPLCRAVDVLHADGTAILPALRQDEFSQATPAGTAVFSGERLSRFLDGENSENGGDGDA